MAQQQTVKAVKQRGTLRNVFGAVNNISAMIYIASDTALETTHGVQGAAYKAAAEMRKMKFD